MRAGRHPRPRRVPGCPGPPLGEEQEAHALAVLQVRQHRLQGAPGRLAAGLVAVETEQDARYQAEQALDVFLAGRRAEGRHRVADALLGQGDDIHVALDHHDLVEVAILLPGFVESVEFLALVEDRSLREFRYFGLSSPSTRPPKAMIRPRLSRIGNITRSRKRS